MKNPTLIVVLVCAIGFIIVGILSCRNRATPQSSDREQVAAAIKQFGAEYKKVYNVDPVWTKRVNTGDESAIDELIKIACDKTGTSTNLFIQLTSNDPAMANMLKQAVIDAQMPGAPDPNRPGFRESKGARKE